MGRMQPILRRLAACLLVLALLPGAWAAYEDDCAGELSELGLLLGDGSGFRLEDVPTRAQMAVMLTRLLGGEGEALDQALPHPYTDTRPWLAPYLGWLYARGLIRGTGETAFGPDEPCTAAMYCTVLLRALGYSEEAGDFTYAAACSDALRLGAAQWPLWEDGFTRGDMAILSRTALTQPMAGETQTLFESLMAADAVAPEAGSAFLARVETENALRSTLQTTRQIMHAGGALDGLTLTNSLEALDHHYARGERCFEIDLTLTADGHIVCLHDWNPALLPGFARFPLTLEEFSGGKIYGTYTATTAEMLLEWLAAHPDATLITDMKSDQLTIHAALAGMAGPLQARIIPQMYDFSEYDALRAMGYDNIILTLYRFSGSISADAALISDYALEHRLLGITFDKTLLTPAYAETLAESGAALFTHTVTLPEEAEHCYRMGVTGVYRD